MNIQVLVFETVRNLLNKSQSNVSPQKKRKQLLDNNQTILFTVEILTRKILKNNKNTNYMYIVT